MTREKIKEELRNIFLKVKKEKTEITIDEESLLDDDLDLDSLERVEVLFEIEQDFSIKVSDEEARGFIAVKDIIDMIQDKTK